MQPDTAPAVTHARASARPAWAYLAIGVLAALAVLTITTVHTRAAPIVLVSAASSVAVIVGIRRYRPARPAGWWFIVAANTAATLGGLPLISTQQSPGLRIAGELVGFCSYPLFAAAAFCWLPRGRPAWLSTMAADALVATLGVSMFVWILLISPAVNTSSASDDPRVVGGVHLAMTALIIILLTQAAFGSIRRNTSFLLVYLGLLAAGAANLVMALTADVAQPNLYAYAGFTLYYALVGAAGLHPDMARIPTTEVLRDNRFRQRFAELAFVCLLAATIPMVRPPFGLFDRLVRGTIMILLIVIALIRSERALRAIARNEARAQYRAGHDELTGLPNRTRLRTPPGPPPGWTLAVLLIDLDSFKLVNDSYGHRVGDELIAAAGHRLAAISPPGQVYRYGGDEFVVLAHLAPEVDLENFALRIAERFDTPFQLSTGRVFVSASIGISHRPAGGDPDLDELIREADSAMYHAKATGHGCAVFDDELRAVAVHELEISSALREAVAKREFELHYEPIVELSSGKPVAYEALLRWRHRGELRPPSYFLRVAESSDAILRIGAWVLDCALGDLARAWEESSARPAISVNVSARQLRDRTFVETVVAALSAHRLPATALWLELTETTLIDDPPLALAILDHLSLLGVTICLDDFGTGYSALSNLTHYPIDIVKIDRSFVHGLGGDNEGAVHASAVVNAVEAMCTTLGLASVAEGVETSETAAAAGAIGCRYAQGWLYSTATLGGPGDGCPAPTDEPARRSSRTA